MNIFDLVYIAVEIVYFFPVAFKPLRVERSGKNNILNDVIFKKRKTTGIMMIQMRYTQVIT